MISLTWDIPDIGSLQQGCSVAAAACIAEVGIAVVVDVAVVAGSSIGSTAAVAGGVRKQLAWLWFPSGTKEITRTKGQQEPRQPL